MLILRILLTLTLMLPALLFAGEQPDALVSVSVASLRSAPSHSSEMETQALMGTPVKLGEHSGDWIMAELPDGYSAYIHHSAVTPVDFMQWTASPRLIATLPVETHIIADTLNPASVLSDFPLGCIVEGVKNATGNFSQITMPDGRKGFVYSVAVEPFRQWMTREFDPLRIVRLAEALTGVPYLWGGRSSKMIDCSGLTQLCYFDSGLLLPRNASAQAEIGTDVPLNSLQPADLLFFRNENGKVTHVAIHKSGSLYIHASGMVHTSSRDSSHPLYNGRTVHFARHPAGVTRVSDSPWYF